MTGNNLTTVGPASPSERYLSLDALRGFALFGILVVNIQCFAMIFATLVNPTSFGDLTGLNYWVAMLTHIFAASKFITLFSLLFGAGILLMTRNIEKKGRKSAGKHYLRMMWLIIFGLMHAYLLWYGDVLVSYGLCGLLVFLFRKMSPRKLLIIGLIGISIASLIFVVVDWSVPHWPEDLKKMSAQSIQPDEETINREINIYRGGWLDQISSARSDRAADSPQRISTDKDPAKDDVSVPELPPGDFSISGRVITRDGAPVQGPWGWRPLGWIALSILLFGFLLERVGMVPTIVATVFVAAAAGREFRFQEVLVLAVLITVFCVGAFSYGLRLPLRLFGGF